MDFTFKNFAPRADAADIESLIKIALEEVHPLVLAEFEKFGGIAPPGSALDQNGFVDGDKIICDLLDHGEPGSALEHLLYMIEEIGLKVSPDTCAGIDTAGRAMQMDPALWSFLHRGT
jgi:hypothetical protein